MTTTYICPPLRTLHLYIFDRCQAQPRRNRRPQWTRPPCLTPHSDHLHRIFAPPTTPLQHRLRAPSRCRPPHLNRSRCRKWRSKRIQRQTLRLRAPPSLRRPLLIRRRPIELRPRREPRHLPRRPRLHPHSPQPLARRHRLLGRRPTYSQRTQTELFVASAATDTTTLDGTTTVLCATEAKSYLCKRAE
jgi:hypothetical protein